MVAIGIVGSEAAKFTPNMERAARKLIRMIISHNPTSLVISGRSPLGGIDWWAIEEAEQLGIPTHEYPPLANNWEEGFRPRNIQIAEASDMVFCITVKQLHPGYRGRRFDGCYHCHTPPEHHVKSGGCWTMREAWRREKPARLAVVDLDDDEGSFGDQA